MIFSRGADFCRLFLRSDQIDFQPKINLADSTLF